MTVCNTTLVVGTMAGPPRLEPADPDELENPLPPILMTPLIPELVERQR
jgi:hypothetical protein